LGVGAREGAASRLVYLYGFVEAEDRAGSAALAGVVGVDPDADVHLVREGPVAAVVSEVQADEFSEAALARKLNDIGSLESVARGHERVLDALVASGTVLPARLATLYRNEDDVRRVAAEQQSALTKAFRRLAGVREWGVKVFVRRPCLLKRLEEQGAAGPASSAARAVPQGAAYLAERQRRQELERRLRSEVLARADEVHEALRGLATASRLVGTRAELPGDDLGELALNAAYLVRREDEGALRELVASFERRLDGRGFVVRLTGPWPPYNFLEEPLA
jgi:hypothetical protein